MENTDKYKQLTQNYIDAKKNILKIMRNRPELSGCSQSIAAITVIDWRGNPAFSPVIQVYGELTRNGKIKLWSTPVERASFEEIVSTRCLHLAQNLHAAALEVFELSTTSKFANQSDFTNHPEREATFNFEWNCFKFDNVSKKYTACGFLDQV
jgi:hypothetical protein